MTRALRLNVLGRFEAQWSDGQRVDLTRKKAQALVAFLAVEPSRLQTREQLATLLWSNMDDERARHNLRQALSHLRAVCGEIFVAEGDCLTLNQTVVTADVGEFERLAASEAPDDLMRSVSLYRGELLEGFTTREEAFNDWLVIARGRLRQQACETAARLAQVLRQLDRLDECIGTLHDLLVIDPAYEPAHRELMELLGASGRRAEALRQYQTCVEALERELGAAPDRATEELYQQLKQARSTREEPLSPSVETRSARAAHPTVAVLPFQNLAAQEDGYFVDGIVEDLITSLSCFGALLVIARGSTFAYRDSVLADRAIAAELGAQFLVRGSIQRAGSHVRINVQLLDAVAGVTVWAHRYDREMEDVFVLQDEITSTLVSTLAGRVEAARLNAARAAPPDRLAAYDCLLRGKDYHHRFTAEDCDRCIRMFEQAIERDPTYAVAHAWLGCALGQAMVFALDDIPTLVDRAQAAAERGLELDENESECHRILAQVHLTRGNLSRALKHQERALQLNPNDDRSVCAMGELLCFSGRHDEAEQWVGKSMKLNPYHPQRYWTHLARVLLHLGRFDETLEALDHIDKRRRDDHVYAITASVAIGDETILGRNLEAMRRDLRDFEFAEFVDSMPYGRSADRELIRGALVTAGLIPA